MDNSIRYVTHDECEEYRKEFNEKLNGQNIRITIIETNFKTFGTLIKIVLGAVLGSWATILATLLLK